MSNINFYKGNENLKAAGVSQDFTQEQIVELTKCAQDPVHFLENYVRIVHVDHGIVPFIPWDFQKDLIRKVEASRRVLALWGRQIGKTTTVAAMMLWYAMFNERFTIAILAHKVEQAIEILYRIQESYQLLPHWMQIGVVEWNKKSCTFANKSRIFVGATSGGSIRGKSINILFLDEFSHVERGLQDEFFTGVMPTISSGKNTKIIITTTPKGLDLFYKLWTDSVEERNDYVRSFANWNSVPGRGEAWKKEQVAATSERQFEQEHEVAFMGSTNTLIDSKVLQRLAYTESLGSVGDLKIFERPVKDRNYVCCVDCSEGLNQDYHAMSILDVSSVPYKVVATFHNNNIHHLLLPNYIYNACRLYNEAMCFIETQSTGSQVATLLLQDLEYENVIATTVKGRNGQRIGGGFGGEVRLGVMMNKQVKRIGCTNLKALIEQDKIMLRDVKIVKELMTFVNNDKQSFEAEAGYNDDLVMTLVIFAWAAAQNYFREVTDTDVRADMVNDNISALEQDMTPFGFIHDHQEEDGPEPYQNF